MTSPAGEPLLPDLFARAVELDDTGRRSFVAEIASRDAALAVELERLLASADRDTSPLDRTPWRSLAAEAPEGSPLPESLGGFRIVRELGRGGMGRVFLAEQETRDFRRTVALKIIDRPAVDADAVRRFRDEVRILSRLEHPGIARFVDGGRSDDGTFFIALEYVEGEDLLAHAARLQLPLRARLELFLAALDAVRHAHEHGVVHRDLKPSHLLVGKDGRPRLLDFGISKVFDPEAAAPVTVTRTESRALTPAYASPEQFRGEPVTPASDVYSLGVILYELLAGTRPFADAVGTGALERAVLESDPRPPSVEARSSTSGGGPRSSRGTRPTRSDRLSRDLDAVCLKALRKRPEERYADSGALARDLERYLVGRPVEARRGGLRYRFGRFLHRNRAALVTAAAIVLAAAAALVAWRAHLQVAELRPVEPEPRPFPFSDVGLRPPDELERAFAARPADVDAGATLVLGLIHAHRLEQARLVVSRLRQIPGEAANPLIDYVDALLAVELEEPQRALVLYTQARDRAISGGRGELVAQVRASRGRLLSTLGQRVEAGSEMELARADFERAGDHASLSRVLNDLAIEELQQGRLDRGEAMLKRGVEEGRLAGTTVHWMLRNLAELDNYRGRPDRAEIYVRELVKIHRESGNRRYLGDALVVLGSTLFELGRSAEAEAPREEGLALLRESGETALELNALMARQFTDFARARFDRFESTVREIRSRASLGGNFNGAAIAASLSAHRASYRGDLAAMRREFEVARQLLSANGDKDQAADLDAMAAIAEWSAGNSAEAARLADQALQRLPEGAADSRAHVLAQTQLARVDAVEGRTAEASARLARLGELAESPSVERRLQFLAARAELAKVEGRFEDARRDLEESVAAAARALRRLDELQLRFDRALLERAAGEARAARDIALAVAVESEAVGLVALADKARREADSAAD